MDTEKLLQNLRVITQEPHLQANSPLKSVKHWDSLAAVDFVALLDADYSITIAYDEMLACATVGDLIRLAEHHAASG